MAKTNAYRPQSAFSVNGIWFEDEIPGYHTLNTKNRYLIEKQLTLRENTATDGSVMTRTKYPVREIEVEYMINCASLDDFQTSYLKLMGYLDTENAQIIFNGEPDKYVIGTFVAPSNVEETQATRSGTYKIVCTDPFKYSVAEYSENATSNTWVINYDGTYKAHPTFVVDFPLTLNGSGDNTDTSECGFVGLATQSGAVLQFGDPNEKDWGDVDYPAKTPLNKTFSATTGWTIDGAATLGANYEIAAGSTVSANSTDKYIYPSNYGSGSAFHGPTISKTLNDVTASTNFKFSWKQKYLTSNKNQQGCTSVLLYRNDSGTRTLIAGVHFEKTTTNDAKTKIYYYAGSTTAKNPNGITVACSKVGSSTITKEDNVITFNVAGKTASYQLDDTTAAKIVNEVVFYFGQKSTKAAINANYVYNAMLTRFEYSKYENVENAFMPGDILTVNCKEARVYMDNGDSTTPADSLGALGNDWETFVLTPGTNTILIDYSTFTTTPPTATIKYRKVYL